MNAPDSIPVDRFQHKEMAAGRWWTLSIFEQLGNIGSEISRALKWKGRNPALSQGAVVRALELFDLTLADPRYRASVARLREIARAREVFLDFAIGSNQYQSTQENLQRWFDQFAIAAQRTRR